MTHVYWLMMEKSFNHKKLSEINGFAMLSPCSFDIVELDVASPGGRKRKCKVLDLSDMSISTGYAVVTSKYSESMKFADILNEILRGAAVKTESSNDTICNPKLT